MNIPQNKFPGLYEALHRRARRDAMIARIKLGVFCVAALGLAVYVGGAL